MATYPFSIQKMVRPQNEMFTQPNASPVSPGGPGPMRTPTSTNPRLAAIKRRLGGRTAQRAI